MKTALILHGWDGDSQNNWFPWLKKELEERWYQTIIPDLPNTDLPNLLEQMESLQKYAHQLKSGDLIVGHSLGCQLATYFIEQNNLVDLNVILVAPSYPWLAQELGKEILWDAYDTISTYYNTSHTFADLWNNHVVFLSEDDPYINLEHAEEYYCNFREMEFVEFSDKWHFNSKAGIFELEEVLEYV